MGSSEGAGGVEVPGVRGKRRAETTRSTRRTDGVSLLLEAKKERATLDQRLLPPGRDTNAVATKGEA
jgi:hypothetical protein